MSELADLWGEAVPDEPLIEDELEACWRADGVVIGTSDGVVVAHRSSDRTYLDLVAVRPRARRKGLASTLVEAAIEALETVRSGDTVQSRDTVRSSDTVQSRETVQFGASVPWYLWSGIDSANTAALALAESLGFENRSPATLNMVVDPRWQAGLDHREGLVVRRVDNGDEGAAVLDALENEYPHWVDEVSRGIEQSTVHAVWDDSGGLLGIGAHSVNRLGWIGPMATFEAGGRGRGVGTVALAAVCRDLASAGYLEAEIAWVGPIRFYQRAAGARVGRVFLPMTRTVTRLA